MDTLFYFGPDKLPFSLSEDGIVEPISAVPFHGIISRGLLQRFIHNNISSPSWLVTAPKLFDKSYSSDDVKLKEIRAHALDCKLLSFGQSAHAVRTYVNGFCKANSKALANLELWNIKEGHTSSVWKVTMKSEKNLETFVVNVARDKKAGKELKESSRKLQTIGIEYPNLNCAKVYEVCTLEDKFLPPKTIVTRNEWVANSFEIHIRSNKKTNKNEFLLVERFLTAPESPSKITSVMGRLFSQAESNKIQKEINLFKTKATEALGKKIDLSLNDGDVVWNGKQTMVVAIN